MDDKKRLIVGWGLAGATLAWQHYFSSKSFAVYDSNRNFSTRTAAGIVNPIVFKRLTKSWNADLLMPCADQFYKKIESVLEEKLIHQKHIFKVFSSFEDENNWAVRQSDSAFKPYLVPLKNHQVNLVESPFGFGEVKTFGNLDTNKFLNLSKSFFIKEGIAFADDQFDYNLLDPSNLIYLNQQFEQIFFCEGVGLKQNPYFNYLPLKPTHGETITIETDQFKFDHILNKNMFIMHLEGNQFKVGATYNWDLSEPETTESGKNELIEKLKSFTNFDFKVIDHQAGIRPTVKDRRPLIGEHPEYNGLFIFNGLGTKGVMIAPYYAEQLLASIDLNGQLDNEVNIDRYKKYLH